MLHLKNSPNNNRNKLIYYPSDINSKIMFRNFNLFVFVEGFPSQKQILSQ